MVGTRAQRDILISKILVIIGSIFSCSTMRTYFQSLDFVSNHKIKCKRFSFSSREKILNLVLKNKIFVHISCCILQIEIYENTIKCINHLCSLCHYRSGERPTFTVASNYIVHVHLTINYIHFHPTSAETFVLILFWQCFELWKTRPDLSFAQLHCI